MQTTFPPPQPRPRAGLAAPAQPTRILVYGPDGMLAPCLHSQPAYSSAALAWHGFALERHRLPPGSTPLAAAPSHILILPLTHTPSNSVTWRAGNQILLGHMDPQRVYLRAAEEDFACAWSAPFETLLLAIDPPSLAWAHDLLEVTGQQTLTTRLASDNTAADPGLRHVILQLDHCARGENPHGSLYEESLLLALGLKLVMRYRADGRGHHPPPRSGALSARKLDAVQDYVWANLARPLTLDRIAQAAHLSTYHLCRQFRATLPLSLWQYVLACRAAYARRLIARHPDMPLASVASASGFESYSAFYNACQKTCGVSPLAIRAALSSGAHALTQSLFKVFS